MRHIRQEGHALYQRHARLHPHGLPGVALKVLRSLSYSLKGSYHTETSLAAIIKSGSLRCGGVAERLLSAKQKSSVLPMQVVSDIDDTLMCSGGSYPAGRDTRYPHNCVYPGILAFYNELDVGHVQRSEIQVTFCAIRLA